MSKIKYWKILHTPDTTETGSCMNATYVKTEWKGFPGQQSYEKEIMEDFCYENYGPQVDYVQGVAPTLAWIVVEIDETRFDESKPLRFGYTPEKIQLQLGDRKSKEKIKKIDSIDFLWRSDGQRFSRNDDGTYSSDSTRELQPACFYRYTYKRLMDTGEFSVKPY